MNRLTSTNYLSNASDFKFLEARPGITMVLRPDTPFYTILAVSDDFVTTSGRKREEVIGKSHFAIFPENPANPSSGRHSLLNSFDHILQHKTSHSLPLVRYDIPDGKGGFLEKYWKSTNSPVLNDNGEVAYVIHTSEDVTDRVLADRTEEKHNDLQRAYNKLEESQHRFRTLIEEAPVATGLYIGEELTIQYANDIMIGYWGKDHEVLGRSLKEAVPELKGQPFIDYLNHVYTTGEAYVGKEEKIMLAVEGELRAFYFNFTYKALRDKEGSIYGIHHMAIDVTEQVLDRIRIEESEAKYRSLFESMEQGFCVVEMIFDENNKPVDYWFVETNRVFEQQTGLKQALGKTALELLPDLEPHWIEIYGKVALSGQSIRFTERSKVMGKWFDVNAYRNGGKDSKRVALLFTDITEQRRTEEILKESEQRFRNLADESPMFIFIIDPDPVAPVSYWNKTWLHYTGQTAEEAAGRAWNGIIHPEDIQLVMEHYVPAFTAKAPYFIPAVRTKRYDGEYRWYSYKGTPRYTATGEFNGYVGVGFDVHEQKIAEEKLAYRSALLEAHNQAGVDGILLVDAKGGIISYNQRYVEIWNMPQHILDAKDEEVAFSFAMTQLVNPQQFLEKVNYLYSNPTVTTLDVLEFKEGKIVERYGYPVIGEDGRYYAWSWTFKDITERKKIEQDLKNAKEQLELTFKNIPSGVYLINQKGDMVYVNDRGAAVYGDFTPEYLLAHKDLSFLLKKADELFERYDENGNYFSPQHSPAYISLTTGRPSQTVLRQINRTTREQRWHYVQGAPLFDDERNVSMVLVTSTDITVQKVAEEKLKENEERFRSLANSIPQLAWMADAEGWIYWYNDKWYEFTGTTPEQMEGWGWQSVHDPEKLPDVLQGWKNSITTGQPFEMVFPIKGPNGKFSQFLTRVLPVVNSEGKIHQWFGTSTDITEQINAEEELKRVKDQLELTFQNVPSAIYHFDKDGKILYLNEIGARQMGYQTPEEVLAEKDVFQLKRKLDETFIVLNEKGSPLAVNETSVAISLQTGKAAEVVSQLIHRHTGQSYWYLSTSSPLFNEKGELSIVLTTSTDITLQKTSEHAIRQSEERFRTLAETLPQMIWVRNVNGQMEYGSKKWEDYSGIKDVREAWTAITHPDDWEAIMSVWRKAVEKGKPFKYEARLKNKEGEYRWHSAVGEPVKDVEGNIIKWIGALTDIQEQKTFSQQLEKLVAERTKELQRSNEDLQQFAHVASHDLKEPVRKIMTFGNRLKQEFGTELPEKAVSYLSKVESSAIRMYSMIDGVLLYSSLDALEDTKESIELKEILQSIESDLEVLITQKEATIQYSDMPFIEGSNILIYQLFYNLINNSLKFSSPDRKPLIQLNAVPATSEEVGSRNLNKARKYIKITLQDNGIGFRDEQAEKIFGTFTRLHSKDKFEGTGLGLSLCKKIVERHGGFICAKGREGQGATFELILPIT
jgi:PAS domain S-box-containing protein